MAFDVPANIVLPVDDIDVRLDPGPHPIQRDRAQAIAENWEREKVLKPALFDGTVVLLSELAYAGGRLSGRCHAVGYSTFLYWRKDGAATAMHAFAHAMLVSSDNALVAIRMADHTVNAGRVYFAAGSFEPEDFVDRQVDVHFNMAREVGEETGLDLDPVRRDERHHALSLANGTVIFRRYYLDMPADEIARRIAAHAATEEMPEIAESVVIRSANDLPDGLMPHMKPLIEWHFSPFSP